MVLLSLPFDLLINKPPTHGIINKEKGFQPLPNLFLLWKLSFLSKIERLLLQMYDGVGMDMNVGDAFQTGVRMNGFDDMEVDLNDDASASGASL